jgi:TIR domain
MKAFLSYSSKDKSLVREIADEIRVRGGAVWLDERELSAGTPLASALSAALNDIDIFVILITENSVTSPWVKYEIDQVMPVVIERSIRVLPLRFGNAPIPPTLHGYLYADGSNPDALRRAINLAFASSNIVYHFAIPKYKLDTLSVCNPNFACASLGRKTLPIVRFWAQQNDDTSPSAIISNSAAAHLERFSRICL